MEIDEVIETPNGGVSFKATLNPEQVTAMVRWFITAMITTGAVTYAKQQVPTNESPKLIQ